MLVCDGFLKDADLIGQLRNKNLWQRVPSYNWWDGWWRSSPASPVEKTIQNIWERQIAESEIAGFEYWFNILTNEANLKWHRDCDEGLRRRKGHCVSPVIGSVYYVIVRDVIGGFMELSDKDSLIELEASELHRIRPVENRLVVFNPSFWHQVSRLARGIRVASQVNLWTEKPETFALGDHVDKKFQPVT
jgi:hypothetical protein